MRFFCFTSPFSMEFPMRVPLAIPVILCGFLFSATCCTFATAKEKLVPGSQAAREVKVKSGGKEVTMRFWQFVPKSYNGRKTFPLMRRQPGCRQEVGPTEARREA